MEKKIPLLHKQFPSVFLSELEKWNEETSAEEIVPEETNYTLLTDDLITFLAPRCSGQMLALILTLKNRCDYGDYTTAKISDKALAKWSGLNQATIWRLRSHQDFRKLVDVLDGAPRAAGKAGVTTTYLLRPLWTAYREWRRLREVGYESHDDMPEIEEVRRRTRHLTRFGSRTGILGDHAWVASLGDEVVADAIKRSADLVDAARLLIEERYPDAITGMYEHMGSDVPYRLAKRLEEKAA